jgi:hypothetical protein
LGGYVVEGLELGVVAENVQHGTVGLPQELEPGSDDLSVRAVLGVLAAHLAEHEALGCLLGIQIFDVESDFLGLALRLLSVVFGLLQEMLDHMSQRSYVDLLADAPVLMQTILGLLTLPELNAQCDVEDLKTKQTINFRSLRSFHSSIDKYHQILERLLPCAVTSGSDDSAELLEGLISLVGRDSKKFCIMKEGRSEPRFPCSAFSRRRRNLPCARWRAFSGFANDMVVLGNRDEQPSSRESLQHWR